MEQEMKVEMKQEMLSNVELILVAERHVLCACDGLTE